MASNNGKSQVAFSLVKKKKKTNVAPALNDFAQQEQEESARGARRQERTTPLVIPVQPNTTGALLLSSKKRTANDDDEDAAAAQQLTEAAHQHFSTAVNEEGSTNFSADGSLKITSAANTFERKTTEEQQLHLDLQGRAEDVAVDSNVYEKTPIAEFGAALLRGMGWKGDSTTKKEDDNTSMPRPHRLGLGATPKLNTTAAPGRIKTQHQVEREKRLVQQQQEYQARSLKQQKMDKQQTLQNGSIILHSNKRARMVKLMGVPGLNQVLIQYEGDSFTTFVKRGDVALVSRDELNQRPYQETPPPKDDKRDNDRKNVEGRIKREEGADGRIKREDGDERSSSRRRDDERRIKREEDDDYKRSSGRDDKRRRDDRDRREDRRKRSREKDRHDDRKRSRHEQHWLVPSIRVRVVTKKLDYYKEKGLVLDVTHGGAYATLQMANGQLLDRVPERYLETALPKVGGNAIVLSGKHRLAKGKLLERNSDSGTGVIQVFEDMNVVKLSLDDMAEWCGPLDDDVEL